ncbi:hypothetical protein T484DRAFT_1846959, partial [Baffinella frigidus]
MQGPAATNSTPECKVGRIGCLRHCQLATGAGSVPARGSVPSENHRNRAHRLQTVSCFLFCKAFIMGSSQDAYVIEDDSIGSPQREDRSGTPKRSADAEDDFPRAKVSRRTDDDEVGGGSGRGRGVDREVFSVEKNGRGIDNSSEAGEEEEGIDLTASPKGGRSGGAERGAERRFSGGSDVVEMIDDSVEPEDDGNASDSSAVSSKSIDYGGATSSSFQRAKPPPPPPAREPARPPQPSNNGAHAGGGHADDILIIDSPTDRARPVLGDVFQVEQGED